MALSHKYYKHIDESPTVDDYTPSLLKDSSPYVRPECMDCEAKATCGGGCPAAIILDDKAAALDASNCRISRYFVKKMIELLWTEIDQSDRVKEKGYYIPDYNDRRKLYGNIPMNSKKMDFQYIPDIVK
jgi:radical SAM protein with 4Fe4S-binding SPASM domain